LRARNTSIASLAAAMVTLAMLAAYSLVEANPSASKIFYLGAAAALLLTGVFTGLRGC